MTTTAPGVDISIGSVESVAQFNASEGRYGTANMLRELRSALTARDGLMREWLEAEETPMPYAEEGVEAQRAWSYRRHAARDAVRAILAQGETK